MSLTPFVYSDTALDGVDVGALLPLHAETAKHLTTVLRLRAGAHVVVSDGFGRSATGELVDADTVTLITPVTHHAAPDVAVVLAQGVPKLKKLDTVVRLATEGGVATVVPVVTARSPVKLADVSAPRQSERLSAVSMAAGEQARRPRKMTVAEPKSFSDLCDTLSGTPWLVCDVDGVSLDKAMATLGPHALAAGTLTVMIGPEGGFTPDELAYAKTAGAVVVRLTGSVLRSEHAGLFAVGAITALLETLAR